MLQFSNYKQVLSVLTEASGCRCVGSSRSSSSGSEFPNGSTDRRPLRSVAAVAWIDRGDRELAVGAVGRRRRPLGDRHEVGVLQNTSHSSALLIFQLLFNVAFSSSDINFYGANCNVQKPLSMIVFRRCGVCSCAIGTVDTDDHSIHCSGGDGIDVICVSSCFIA